METYVPGHDPPTGSRHADPFLSFLRTHYNVAFAGSVRGLVTAHDSVDAPSFTDPKLQTKALAGAKFTSQLAKG